MLFPVHPMVMKIYAQQTAKTIYRTIESECENERLTHTHTRKKDFQFYFYGNFSVFSQKRLDYRLCVDVAWINWDNAF